MDRNLRIQLFKNCKDLGYQYSVGDRFRNIFDDQLLVASHVGHLRTAVPGCD